MYSEFYDPIKKVKWLTVAIFTAGPIIYVVTQIHGFVPSSPSYNILVVQCGLEPSKSLKRSLLKSEALQCHVAGCRWIMAEKAACAMCVCCNSQQGCFGRSQVGMGALQVVWMYVATFAGQRSPSPATSSMYVTDMLRGYTWKNRLHLIDEMEDVREEGGNLEKHQALLSPQPEGENICHSHILQLFFKLKLLLQGVLDYLEFWRRAAGSGECTTKRGFLRALPSFCNILGHCFPELFHGPLFLYCTLFYQHITHASVECHMCSIKVNRNRPLLFPFVCDLRLWKSSSVGISLICS